MTEGCSKSRKQTTKNTAKGRNVLFPIFHIIHFSSSCPHMTGDMEELFLFAKKPLYRIL